MLINRKRLKKFIIFIPIFWIFHLYTNRFCQKSMPYILVIKDNIKIINIMNLCLNIKDSKLWMCHTDKFECDLCEKNFGSIESLETYLNTWTWQEWSIFYWTLAYKTLKYWLTVSVKWYLYNGKIPRYDLDDLLDQSVWLCQWNCLK